MYQKTSETWRFLVNQENPSKITRFFSYNSDGSTDKHCQSDFKSTTDLIYPVDQMLKNVGSNHWSCWMTSTSRSLYFILFQGSNGVRPATWGHVGSLVRSAIIKRALSPNWSIWVSTRLTLISHSYSTVHHHHLTGFLIVCKMNSLQQIHWEEIVFTRRGLTNILRSFQINWWVVYALASIQKRLLVRIPITLRLFITYHYYIF